MSIKEAEVIFLENKELIEGMAIHGTRPDATSSKLEPIIEAAKAIDIDVNFGGCTCSNEFTYLVEKINAYCVSKNWFAKK